MPFRNSESTSDLEIRVSEAIDKLDELKGNTIWWTTGDQLQASMERKDTIFTGAWSGRVASAQKTLCKNSSQNACNLQVFPNSALVSIDWWIVPKNSSNAENTFKLLRSLYSPESLKAATTFAASQGYSIPVDNLTVADSTTSYCVKAGSIRNPNKISRLDSKFCSKNFTWINKKWKDWRFKQ